MAKKKKTSGVKVDNNAKNTAIISYITWIGWAISLIMDGEKKNEFIRFHMRQSLMIWVVCLPVPIPIIGWAWGVVLLVLLIMGIISANNGEKKEIPLIGQLSQEWFKGL
jgi:uncharacterized membrane protein